MSCAAISLRRQRSHLNLSASPNDGRESWAPSSPRATAADERASLYESVWSEGSGSAVHVWAKPASHSGQVAHAVSRDGGALPGSEVDYDAQLTGSSPSPMPSPSPALMTAAGASSRAAQEHRLRQCLPDAAFRGCGVHAPEPRRRRHLAPPTGSSTRAYVYQCMAQLPGGDIACCKERSGGHLLTTVPGLADQ